MALASVIVADDANAAVAIKVALAQGPANIAGLRLDKQRAVLHEEGRISRAPARIESLEIVLERCLARAGSKSGPREESSKAAKSQRIISSHHDMPNTHS